MLCVMMYNRMFYYVNLTLKTKKDVIHGFCNQVSLCFNGKTQYTDITFCMLKQYVEVYTLT